MIIYLSFFTCMAYMNVNEVVIMMKGENDLRLKILKLLFFKFWKMLCC